MPDPPTLRPFDKLRTGRAQDGNRADDILGRDGSRLRQYLAELYQKILRGFEAQSQRADDIMDFWDCYNCELGPKQFYNGTSQIYVPIIHDAVEARATRFSNQLFPASGRYVEVTPADGHQPMATLALVEHYIEKRRLKTAIVKPLCRNGDIEGHYNLYVDWNVVTRHVVSRETRPPAIRMGEAEIEIPGAEEIDVIIDETIKDGAPALEVIHDSDVLVAPETADSIEDALEKGGTVTIVRRWTESWVERLVDEGEINRRDGEKLLASMRDAMQANRPVKADVAKQLTESAGIRQRGRYVFVYETWHKLPLDEAGRYDPKGGEKKLCRIYYGGDSQAIGCKRNPFWSDLCPLLSEAAVKLAGVFKGKSIVKAVATMQYHANDVANEGADSATYALLPIIMTDPEKNPRTNTMILNLAAIWETDPASTQFAQFPKLWQDALALIQADTQQIFQSMGINPAMLPQQTGRPGAKRNQAEIALEQQVDIMATAEQVAVLGDAILSPMANRFVELDHQFRDRDLTIRLFGSLGLKARMEQIPPIQITNNYAFTWIGVEAARNAMMQQQQVAWLNVTRGLAPLLQQEGFRLKVAPAIEASAVSVFGPRIAPLILEDQRAALSVDPEIENEIMADGEDMPVHPLDDDVRHIESHQRAAQATGDPHGWLKIHLQRHNQQRAQKVQAQMVAQLAQRMAAGAQPGAPGAGGGMPRMGAQPAAARPAQGPPGMIHRDRMPLSFPRKT